MSVSDNLQLITGILNDLFIPPVRITQVEWLRRELSVDKESQQAVHEIDTKTATAILCGKKPSTVEVDEE